MHRAIFLDRDGTLNEEMGYINHVSRFRMFNFVPEAIRIFNNLGLKVFVVTNQSGVARGYFDEQLVQEVHQKLIDQIRKADATIEKIYYCPHHPTEGLGVYKKNCDCRKPKPGMVKKAITEYDLDIKNSFMIGDRYKDVVFGNSLGLRTIMVLTGYGIGEYTYQQEKWEIYPDFIEQNLLSAAKKIQTIISNNKENIKISN